jgi:selenocysteine lyase/cysteine desulfurase
MATHPIDELALALQPHYSHFDVTNRLLFSGHSHQAWPDVALEGIQQAYWDAAHYVDEKWERAFAQTDLLRAYLRTFYDDPTGRYTVSQNTHDVLIRLLSSFSWKPGRIVTTDGEFHTIYRQTRRLEEEGVVVDRLPSLPTTQLYAHLEKALETPATVVMLSRVFFMNALVVHDLPKIASLCRQKQVPLIIDDYHGTNVIPLSIRQTDMEDTFWLIGGYKYLQWGEGNCFLRYPESCSLRPVITGWFSSFGSLSADREKTGILYDHGDNLFMGGTYDPVSQYRAARVAAFFKQMELTPTRLQQQYHAQVQYLRDLFTTLELPESLLQLKHQVRADQTGGFVALESAHAGLIRSKLLEKGVFTDYRKDTLRMGVAPYITTAQMDTAMQTLKRVVESI